MVYDEASESLGWLRLLEPGAHATSKEFHWLLAEADELTRIFSKSFETARGEEQSRRKNPRPGRKPRPEPPPEATPPAEPPPDSA